MSDGAIFAFGAQRNEDYLRVWRFRPRGESVGIDITGWSFKLNFNSASGLGGDPLLEIKDVATAHGSVITIEEAGDGDISILIKAEDIASLPGRPADIVPFAYNMIATDGGGIRRADVRGLFVVEPGV
jgi:hypothetical protein